MKQLKIHCILVITIMLLGRGTVQAQDLLLQFKSGATVSYGLQTVERITFSSTNMQVHIANSTIQGYGLDSIAHYSFQPTVLAVKDASILSSKTLKVYPNPSSDLVNLNYDLPESANVEIAVYSITGQQMLLKRMERSKGYHTEGLSLKGAGLEPGIYFIALKADKKQFINKLILN